MNKKLKEKRETPISDGDTRPDMPLDAERKEKPNSKGHPDKDRKFESERGGDVNSLEDYKDAK